MAVRQPSLPSFAQTFNGAQLPVASNDLPPIRSREPSANRPSPPDDPSTTRKRQRSSEGSHSDRDNQNPSPEVKQEENDHQLPTDSSATAKRRRIGSNTANKLSLNTSVNAASSQNTPLSPVVAGLKDYSGNPAAIEKLRSMTTVKEKQKALIEQRRGSIAGPSATTGNALPVPDDVRQTASLRSSPNPPPASLSLTGPGRRGPAILPPHPPSPQMMVPSHQSHPPPNPNGLTTPSLAQAPISFAKRRATQAGERGKKFKGFKGADIIISPRDAQTPEQFAPLVQSAPPIPQGGGRYGMAIPRLPSIGGGHDIGLRPPGLVPPTPRRFTMQSQINQPPAAAGNLRSPPVPSIATARVPPTPRSFNNPNYTNEKSAFLQPFEMFYDALNDSRQLKSWLGEQLQKSKALNQNLTQQYDQIGELVEGLVERKVGSMRNEIISLHRRVEELEDALRVSPGRRASMDAAMLLATRPRGSLPTRNGLPPGPSGPQDAYTFPPVDRVRHDSVRHSQPSWGSVQERSPPSGLREVFTSSGEPTEYGSRRLSLSASRLEPQSQAGPSGRRSPHSSPPAAYFDNRETLGSRSPGKLSRNRHSDDLPSLHRKQSSSRLSEHSHSPEDRRRQHQQHHPNPSPKMDSAEVSRRRDSVSEKMDAGP